MHMLLKVYFYLSILGLLHFSAHAQEPRFKIITERKGSQIQFFAENTNYIAYQCTITPKNIEILSSFSTNPYYFVVPAQTKKHYLFSLTLKSAKEAPLRFSYRSIMGAPSEYDPCGEYIYQLPYNKGTKHRVLQGYNGKFSHKNQYALDFKMKEGTPICAAREGIVIFAKDDSNEGGRDASFAPKANRIIIKHSDGTMAHYWHLKAKGCLVEIGQRVNAGDVIGLSGNTGWSTEPHLHFVVKRPSYMRSVSIPTKFLTRGLKARKVKAWRKYKSMHLR